MYAQKSYKNNTQPSEPVKLSKGKGKVNEEEEEEESESEDEDLLLGDLITPGSETLNVGPSDRMLWAMETKSNHRVVIDEYGSNLYKSKMDPLAAFEAKTAINSTKKIKWGDEEDREEGEEEMNLTKDSNQHQMQDPISPSPARGTQEEPQVEFSSQEEEPRMTESTHQQILNERDLSDRKQDSEGDNMMEAEKSTGEQMIEEETELDKMSEEEVNNEEIREMEVNVQTTQIEENQARRSSRLMGQNMKIAEKAEELTRKRNLEGTNLNSKNSFAALSDNDVMDKVINMGVKPNVNNMKAVIVVKDLEIARHTLDTKRNHEKKEK